MEPAQYLNYVFTSKCMCICAWMYSSNYIHERWSNGQSEKDLSN